jgi:hypothetical protein
VKDVLAPVRALPFADSTIIAQVRRGTLLSALHSYNDFVRVALPHDAFGWISRSDAATALGGKPKGDREKVEWAYLQAPKIETDLERRALTFVDGQFVNVGGEVSDNEAIKDMFVFVNHKKVFYQSFQDQTLDLHRQKFTATLPLDPGANQVLVIARDTNDLSQRIGVVVQRRSGEVTSKEAAQGEAESKEEMDNFLFDSSY